MDDKERKPRQDPKSTLRFEDKSPADNGAGTSGHIGPKSNKPHTQFREQNAQATVSDGNGYANDFSGDPKLAEKPHTQFREQSAQFEPPNGHGQIGGGNNDSEPKRAKKPHSKFREYSEQLKPSDKLQPGDAPPVGESNRKAARESRGMEKSKLRMEKTGTKLEKATEKRNKKKPQKNPGAIRSAVSNVAAHSRMYAHNKIHEVEHENSGVESAHRTELVGERVGHSASRFIKQRNRTRPARRMKKIENRAFKAKADFQYRKIVQEHPELKKNAITKYMQKRRLKKRYQKQATEAAKKSAKAAKKTATTTGKVIAKIGRALVSNPKVLLIIVMAVVLLFILYSCMGTFSMIGNGAMGGVAGVFEAAETIYTGYETELQTSISNIESTHPGYDEYRYNTGPIGHNLYELTGFVAALDNTPDIESALRELFNEQYTLTTREITETRTETRNMTAGETLGQVWITGYCACEICCGSNNNGITASGATAEVNHTIAVDANNPVLPMGAKIIINGVTYTVEDTGNLAANNADFDIYFATHAEALAWGRRTHTAVLAEDCEVTVTYEYRILDVTLTVRPFTEAIASRLTPEQLEQFNRYDYTQ